MRLILTVFISIILFTTGCMQGEQLGRERETINPNPERISTKDNRQIIIDKNPNKKYTQSDEQGVGLHGTERNIFESEQSLKISQQLARRSEIRQSRIAVTPNRVVVFASLKEFPPDIEKKIEDDVKHHVRNKQIIVFTDKDQWERMRHLESTLKAKEIGDDFDAFLEKYFNLDMKD